MSRVAICVLAVLLSLTTAFQARSQGVITTVAGTTWIFRGDGGPAVNAPLGYITNVGVDSAGNVLAVDRDNSLVVKVSAAGILTVVAGNGLAGFSGEGGRAINASLSFQFLSNPSSGVATDAAGNVYIADSEHARVRKVDSSGIITTVAGNGTVGLFSGDGGPATSASLSQLAGIALDTAGNLYIADSGNGRIRKVDTSGFITTVAGNGTFAFSGDGGPATNAALNFPQGLAVDPTGNLYIADSFNNRIRKVNPGWNDNHRGG